MKYIYFDCQCGASGDMILGALVSLGVSLDAIRSGLKGLNVEGYRIESRSVIRKGVSAAKVDVFIDEAEKQPHRGLREIREIIDSSTLSPWVKEKAVTIFTRMVETEARIHGTTADRVHLHEVGAVDAIVDVCGALIGFETLGVTRFYSSAFRLGVGTFQCAHGVLPVPAPATAELLKGLPVFSGKEEGEMTTPTGAAVISTLAKQYGGIPRGKITAIGYGAGSKDFATLPNVLRLFLGEEEAGDTLPVEGTAVIIEANIDDMNPQICGYAMEKFLEAGALDVFLTPVQMKKGRPGVLFTILSPEESVDKMVDLLFMETTSIGVRIYKVSRRMLQRRIETVETQFGPVRIKVSTLKGRVVTASPEYEDLRKVAAQHGISIKDAHDAAIASFRASATSTKSEE